jgi:hypothetical protein
MRPSTISSQEEAEGRQSPQLRYAPVVTRKQSGTMPRLARRLPARSLLEQGLDLAGS